MRVLILTTFKQDDYVFGALRAGASASLRARSVADQVKLTGHRLLGHPHSTGAGGVRAGVSGLSNREIATKLFVDESTIRSHVKRILMKLDFAIACGS